MKKIFLAVTAGILLVGAVGVYFLVFRPAVGGGEKKQEVAGTPWVYESVMREPLTSKSTATQDVKLGDVATQKVAVLVPAGSFDTDKTIQIVTPQSVPPYVGSKMVPLGAPVELTADGGPARLNKPTTVTFAFDPSALAGNTDPSYVYVAYYNGQVWDTLKPTKVDFVAKTITFDTYHFSLLGGTKISDETELIQKWTHSQALDNKLRGDLNDMGDKVAEQVVDAILEKMGIDEESTKAKILKDVLTDDGYKELADTINEGNVLDMSQKIAIVASASIAKLVPESTLQAGLSHIAGDGAEDVEAVAKAAGYIAEGQFKEATKIIGEQIADKFLITTAGKIAVEIVDYQINSWKNAEVEAAYKAYRDGANATFYGYNVDSGDFDATWDQMRGISRQLQLEAIREANAARAEAGMPPLTSKQEDTMRNQVKESYRKQFEERKKNEEAIKKEEEKLAKLMEAFKDADYFDSVNEPLGLDKFDFETRLQMVYKFAQKMMRDTGRGEFKDLRGIRPDGTLLISDILAGASYYFSGPNGKKAYEEYLKKEFGIAIYPELSNLGGTFSGSLTITDVIAPESTETKPAEPTSNELGCDFDINLKELIGKSSQISLKLSPTGDHAGTIEFTAKDSEAKSFPFSYSSGVISASVSEKGATGNLSLGVSETDTQYSLDGSLDIIFSGGQIKILTLITAQKDKPVPPPPTLPKK